MSAIEALRDAVETIEATGFHALDFRHEAAAVVEVFPAAIVRGALEILFDRLAALPY